MVAHEFRELHNSLILAVAFFLLRYNPHMAVCPHLLLAHKIGKVHSTIIKAKFLAILINHPGTVHLYGRFPIHKLLLSGSVVGIGVGVTFLESSEHKLQSVLSSL